MITWVQNSRRAFQNTRIGNIFQERLTHSHEWETLRH